MILFLGELAPRYRRTRDNKQRLRWTAGPACSAALAIAPSAVTLEI